MRRGVTLVTGASGFVGGAVVARLHRDGRPVRCAIRTRSDHPLSADVVVADLARVDDWAAAVRGVESVVHCAGRAHVVRDAARDPLAEFRRTNVDGTLRVARAAADAGARRFVFLSSIKVNGGSTGERPYSAADAAAPQDPYGLSKHEAETALHALARCTGMEVVVIRPVLVYGPGVGGNFRRLMQLVSRGWPLPFGAVDNRRSLVSVGNLVDLIVACLDHPAAANELFLVSDGEDLSTRDLITCIATSLGREPQLFRVPRAWLRAAATLTRRQPVFERLCGSLQVDISKNRELLGWTPPVATRDALCATVRHFVDERRSLTVR